MEFEEAMMARAAARGDKKARAWLDELDARTGKRLRVYLGGAINGCTDEEAHGWREAVKPVLEAAGHTWIDPMVRDYRGRELEPGVDEEIVEGDKADIRRCDVLLMNCPKPSWGTGMEVFYGASLSDKRVIVVVPEGVKPSPWLTRHADVMHFGSVVEAARLV